MQRSKLILGLVFVSVVVFAVWQVPRWQATRPGTTSQRIIAVEMITSEDDYRHTLVQGLTGLALLASLWMTWKKLAVLEKHALTAEDLQRTTHESKLTERFYRAVQQLANEHTEVRLGGIYALERMISDSARDKDTIQEVLSAYIRLRASEASEGLALREDLRACLAVLARTAPHHVDLGRVSFAGKNLSHLNLSRFWLADSNLSRSDLYRANLRGTLLQNADLKNAEMSEADLRMADLSHANLERANLSRAQLNGANLLGANLRGANLRGVTDLSDAQLASCTTDETTNLPLLPAET